MRHSQTLSDLLVYPIAVLDVALDIAAFFVGGGPLHLHFPHQVHRHRPLFSCVHHGVMVLPPRLDDVQFLQMLPHVRVNGNLIFVETMMGILVAFPQLFKHRVLVDEGQVSLGKEGVHGIDILVNVLGHNFSDNCIGQFKVPCHPVVEVSLELFDIFNPGTLLGNVIQSEAILGGLSDVTLDCPVVVNGHRIVVLVAATESYNQVRVADVFGDGYAGQARVEVVGSVLAVHDPAYLTGHIPLQTVLRVCPYLVLLPVAAKRLVHHLGMQSAKL